MQLDNKEVDQRIQCLKEILDDRERLTENRKMIRKKVSKCLTDNGYKRKGNIVFYQVQEDIIAYFVVEHPSATTYIWFCIYPLFAPPMQYIRMPMGLRLSDAFHDNYVNIRDYYTEIEVDHYCKMIDSFIKTSIVPFVHEISTIHGLYQYLRASENNTQNRIVDMSKNTRYEILMYAELSMHKYLRTMGAARRYLQSIDIPLYTEKVRNEGKASYRQVMDLALKRNAQAVDSMINDWRQQNIHFFTGK